MKPTAGQVTVLKSHNVFNVTTEILFEGGSDNGVTFNGSFIAKSKGSRKRYRFDDGVLVKTF